MELYIPHIPDFIPVPLPHLDVYIVKEMLEQVFNKNTFMFLKNKVKVLAFKKFVSSVLII